MAVRVLWVTKGLGPGGAERLLVAAAGAHDRSRFEIESAYVLPYKDHLAGELEAAGVTCHCLSVRRTDHRWPLRLWRLVRAGGFDVVHVHAPLPGSVARLAARTMPPDLRPLLVSTEHNRWETHRRPTRLLNRLTSRWDDMAVAVTDEVRASMRGPVAGRATTLRHGIDVAGAARWRSERDAVRAELGLGDGLVVGTVANFREQKDYPNLLRAARLLADRGVPVRFVAVGQGPDEEAIRALRSELGLDDVVVLAGFRPDAVRVMAACDAFVLASKWEGLPVAIMESLALGLPIVATRVGGMAEQLHDGDDALLVPPSNPAALAAAIERIVTDDDLRHRLAAASAAQAPEFDIARAVEVFEDVYARRERPDAPPEDRPAPARRARADVEIRDATPDDRDEILRLLGRSLGADPDDPKYRELYSWKHDTNRFGPSPTWVATEGGSIVAVRAFMRWEFERGGHVLRAVRAVDTATDPDHQGKGLFTRLTMHGLEQMRADGVDFVFNTPNDQSRPGYLKMGWRVVGKLPAAVHFTGPGGALTSLRSRVPADRWSQPLDVGEPVPEWLARGGPADRRPVPTDVREIRTRADDEFLAWRFGTPLLGYRVVDDGDAAIIVRARRRGAATELALVATFGDARAADRLAARTARTAGADYVIRIGPRQKGSSWLPLPGGGPVLTWRALNDAGTPPLANWAVSLGDVELF